MFRRPHSDIYLQTGTITVVHYTTAVPVRYQVLFTAAVLLYSSKKVSRVKMRPDESSKKARNFDWEIVPRSERYA